MRAGLDHPSGIQHQDDIGRVDGGQPVRHHDRGAVDHQRIQRRSHQLLADRVEMRRRLVQHQDRRILEERARDGDALALPAGELHAALADAGPQPFRQVGDELRERSLTQRGSDLARRVASGRARRTLASSVSLNR